MNGLVTVYDVTGLSYYYLKQSWRAPGLIEVLSLPTDEDEAIIAVAEVGAWLKSGHIANAKGLYFGISVYDHWTSVSEELFRNSITWLTTDVEAPEISDLAVSDVTDVSALVTWTTDKPASSSLNYGVDENMGTFVYGTDFIESHEVPLSGLSELTTYYYQIEVCSLNGFCRMTDIMTFDTTDLTAPNILSFGVSDVTDITVTIDVLTDEASRVNIYYGISELDSVFSVPGYETDFSIVVDGLIERTSYSYIVEVCDAHDNCQNSSTDYFTTFDFTPPEPPLNLILEVMNSDNSIEVMWDASASIDDIVYNVYFSDTPFEPDFDFTAPDVTTEGVSYLDDTAGLVEERYYIVRAEDGSGNEEENVDMVGKFDLMLNEGYNLVSIPLVSFDSSIDSVMHQTSTYNPVVEVMRFDTVLGEFQSAVFDSDLGVWDTTEFSTMDAATGYFFNSLFGLDFTVVGYPAAEIDVTVYPGMNLLGLTLWSSKEITDVFSNTPTDFSVTEVSDRGSVGRYYTATYYSTDDEWFNPYSIGLDPGLGYWVKSNDEFMLTVIQ